MVAGFPEDSRSRGDGHGCFRGEGADPLEVVVVACDERPTDEFLREGHSDRCGGRSTPGLVVALHDGSAGLCGPDGGVYRVDRDWAERVCEAALAVPGRHDARAFLDRVLPRLDGGLAGLHNRGLLSTRELRVGVPERDDWDEAAVQGRRALASDPRVLLRGLGYEVDRSGVLTDRADGTERAIAVFLQPGESFDRDDERSVGGSPVARALREADRRDLGYVLGCRGDTLRLYTTDPDAGFGSRGRTGTYVAVHTGLLTDEHAAYLWLLFSADALRADGTVEDILSRSGNRAAALGARLRERIYNDVVPDLAAAVVQARDLDDPTRADLDETYRTTLGLVYRLLFLACVEHETSPRHAGRDDTRSLTEMARTLDEFVRNGGEFDETACGYWEDVTALSRAIDRGHDGPQSVGDGDPPSGGAAAGFAEFQLSDAEFGPVLFRLLVDETADGAREPVDFQDTDVRELGLVHAGLLESELSVADKPLALVDGRYEPVDGQGAPDPGVDIEAGEVYLHGQSGERRATGTYYTDPRLVEHLLDHALEPALDDHVDRLDRLRETEGDQAAADAFFDIRVADIAMGAGHTLVGAVDRIGARLCAYLTEHPLPSVETELDRLAEAASGDGADPRPVERDQLLRRQVARRCLYGVDIDPLATELARLSLWAYTFVPGTSSACLDYNLVTGDSLAGVGTLSELRDALDAEGPPSGDDRGVLDSVRDEVDTAGAFADARAEQAGDAAETRAAVTERLEQVRARFDILAAARVDDDIDTDPLPETGPDSTRTESERAAEELAGADPVHFPATFPAVFGGERRGFDVLLGNPPWEEATLEADEFWARYEPGFQAKSQSERDRLRRRLREERPDLVERYERERARQASRRALLREGPFPGMGTGDPDSYKAFSWRCWQLIRDGGRSGLVLPRSAFCAAGSEPLRRRLLDRSVLTDVTFLRNSGNWAFPAVHPQYTIALVSFEKTAPTADDVVPIRGPFTDAGSFDEGHEQPPHAVPVERAKGWTGTAAFPVLPPDPGAGEVLQQMTDAPPLDRDDPDEWRARPNTELHATNDRTTDDGTALMRFCETDTPPDGCWPVLTGGSFDIWCPDAGEPHAWADPDAVREYIQERRVRSYRYAGARSAFYEMSDEWVHDRSTLPCHSPRLVFRDITRATDSRTVRAALAPPEVFLTNKAPYLLWPRGDRRDQAYLLGVLCSMPLDWYARRFVETTLNYHVLNGFPVPRPGPDSRLRRRVVELSGRLAAVDGRYADWAGAVGVGCGPLVTDRKRAMVHELDAVVAHLYGLSREHLDVIFRTFHDGREYDDRLNGVLEYHEQWAEAGG